MYNNYMHQQLIMSASSGKQPLCTSYMHRENRIYLPCMLGCLDVCMFCSFLSSHTCTFRSLCLFVRAFWRLHLCLIACCAYILGVSLFVCLIMFDWCFVCLFVCLSVCPSICLSVCPPVCLSVYLSVCLFVQFFLLSAWLLPGFRLLACLLVRTYVRTYAYVHACMHACMDGWMDGCRYVCMHVGSRWFFLIMAIYVFMSAFMAA